MEPIEMPESWHSQFVGLKINSGHCFRVSKTALTDSIMQVANYAIDIDDGIVLKDRYGATGRFNEAKRVIAKTWPIVHERRFAAGIVYALERAGALSRSVGQVNTTWDRAISSEPSVEEHEWEPEVICAPIYHPSYTGGIS